MSSTSRSEGTSIQVSTPATLNPSNFMMRMPRSGKPLWLEPQSNRQFLAEPGSAFGLDQWHEFPHACDQLRVRRNGLETLNDFFSQAVSDVTRSIVGSTSELCS